MLVAPRYPGAGIHAIPRDQNERQPEDPDISISKGNLTDSAIEATLWPVFSTHGLVPMFSPLTPSPSPPEYRGRGEKNRRTLRRTETGYREPNDLLPLPLYSGGEGGGAG